MGLRLVKPTPAPVTLAKSLLRKITFIGYSSFPPYRILAIEGTEVSALSNTSIHYFVRVGEEGDSMLLHRKP